MVEETQRALADRLFPELRPTEELEIRNIPPEQRRLHTETADLTVSSIHQLLAAGKIEIPEFQRSYVWSRAQASRLIESLIIQCPIPVLYFSQSSDNKLVVIDGNQRLLSIKLYLNDAFPLKGLTTYPELNGLSWSQLDPRFRDHIYNRTLRCITILRDTHPQIKFDVFERLNTGSVQLNAQELRHGLNHGSLMKLLDELAKSEPWRSLVGIRNDKRMKSAELILRFFALRFDRNNYQKPLSGFLDAFSSKYRNADDQLLDVWAKEFVETIKLVNDYFGRIAFKIYDLDLLPKGGFNSAFYDSQMIGFAETTNNSIRIRHWQAEDLQRRLVGLFNNEKFMNSVRAATSDEASVKNRIEMYVQALNTLKS